MITVWALQGRALDRPGGARGLRDRHDRRLHARSCDCAYQTLQRGLMPYVVGSQTIPILAIAPIVVVGLGSLSIAGWTPTDWLRVSVISAYLTSSR